MSCPQRSLVLLLDAEDESAAARRHAASCPECGPLLDELRAARVAAGDFEVPAPVPATARRVRRGAQTGRPPIGWGAALGGAALALVALAVLRPSVEVAPAGAVVRLAAGTLTARDEITVARHRPWTVPRLRRGTAYLRVDGGAPELLETPFAQIRAFEAGCLVEVTEARTHVRVDRGEVTLVGAGQVRRLAAGQSAEVPPRPARDRLSEARTTLRADPGRALALAEEVLAEAPDASSAPLALALVADAHRRAGRLEAAAHGYRRLAEHPRGRAYREEACFRRAQLLARLGRPRAAMDVLRLPMPTRALLPERLRLEAELAVALGDPEAARRLRARADRAEDEAAR